MDQAYPLRAPMIVRALEKDTEDQRNEEKRNWDMDTHT
jgi:hypothetical protein